MVYPEKTDRNESIFYAHLTGRSYREIQLDFHLKSVKSIYRIVARMRARNKNAKGFISAYERKTGVK